MAIELMIGFGCAVKDRLPAARLASLLRARARAEAAIDAAREAGGDADPEAILVEVVGPHGEPRRVPVSALLAAASALAPLEPRCEGCPARALDQPFGCYLAITYPVELRTEEWLLARLPADLDTTAGTMLRRAVADLGYDGAPVARARKDRRLFEAETAPVRRWGGTEPWQLSSDQLLQAILFAGPLAPSHCGMLAVFTGVIPHDVHRDEIAASLADPAAARRIYGNARVVTTRGDSAQVAAAATLLEALAIAASLGVSVAVDA